MRTEHIVTFKFVKIVAYGVLCYAKNYLNLMKHTKSHFIQNDQYLQHSKSRGTTSLIIMKQWHGKIDMV